MDRKVKIIYKEADFAKLTNYLCSIKDIELGAMAFYSISKGADYINLLVQGVIIPRDEDYHSRSSHEMSFNPNFMEKCYQFCEKYNSHLLDIHTHPWAHSANFSPIDDREAIKKIDYMNQYVKDIKISFIVFGHSPHIVQSRIWEGNDHTLEYVDQIIII